MKKGFLHSACLLALLVAIVGIIPEGIRRVSASAALDSCEARILKELSPLFALVGFATVIALLRLAKWLISGGRPPESETKAASSPPGTKAEEIRIVQSQEKNCFYWTYIFLGLGAACYLPSGILEWITSHELKGMETRVRLQKMAELDGALSYLGVLFWICVLGFLYQFFKGFVATRRRMALENQSSQGRRKKPPTLAGGGL